MPNPGREYADDYRPCFLCDVLRPPSELVRLTLHDGETTEELLMCRDHRPGNSLTSPQCPNVKPSCHAEGRDR